MVVWVEETLKGGFAELTITYFAGERTGKFGETICAHLYQLD